MIAPPSPRSAGLPFPRRPTRPAILIDGNSRTDLGVVRALGTCGVPVVLLSSYDRSITAASRYVRRVFHFPPLSTPATERVERLRAIAAALPERPVVFATGDRALAFLSATRTQWEDLIDHDLAPHDVVSTCADKARFAARGTQLGLPIPATWLPESVAEVAASARALTYPVFVKPLDRADWAQLPPGTVHQVKGQAVESAEALVTLWHALDAGGGARAVIQEMVVGPDEEHVTALTYRRADGMVLGTFVGRKTRILPVHAGLGVFVQSVRIPEAAAIAEATMAAFGYTGFVDVDFKRDARTGAYKLLEMNCRYSTWVGLATYAGCNLPAAGYATMIGAEPPPLRQIDGPSWLDWRRDRKAVRDYRREGLWPTSSYVKSLATARAFAFFSARDPLPFVRELVTGEAQ